jgi:tetratricopeptide (TPR) repeat protein
LTQELGIATVASMPLAILRPVLAALLLIATDADASVPVIIEEWANQCRFDDALRAFELTSTSGLRSPDEVAITRARFMLQLGRPEEVMRVLAQVQPPTADLLLLRGLSLADMGHRVDATAALLDARDLGADELLVEVALATADSASFDFKAAEQRLLAALRRDPDLTGALYNLACLYSRQGRLVEAGTYLRRAWAAGWRDVYQLRGDRDLEPLRASGLIGDLMLSDPARCLTW